MIERFHEAPKKDIPLSVRSKEAAIRMTELLSKQQMRQESTPLGEDVLSPEEFLDKRTQILSSEAEGLITEENAAELLTELADQNPAMQTTHDNNVNRSLN